jgi:tetratricopeptide (TPR) repeat protein
MSGKACLGAALLVAALVAGPAQAASDTSAADAAFGAGDHPRALSLYDEVLAADPDNVHALVRSGMLLSWDLRYSEAVARYERVLALDPHHRVAALERAKVLSWDRRFAEAAGAFLSLLASAPDDREARLGLARSLSWGGNQAAARAEYRTVVDTDPRDVEGLVGVAQTYAWSGQPANARTWYERALEVEPGRKEALLGLAYLDLWGGDAVTAERRAQDLEQRFPDDREVGELATAIRAGRTPWVRTAYDAVTDTDDNELDISRLEVGRGLSPRTDAAFGAARYDMTSPGRSSTGDTFYGIFGWRPAKGHRVALRAGTDRNRDSAGVRSSETVGGIVWSWGQGAPWQGSVSANRDTFRYSTDILDAGILVDSYALEASGPLGGRWRTDLGTGLWDLSDGNRRRSAHLGARYRWPVGGVTLDTGYVFRYLDYDEDLDNGYFDPQDFTAHLATASLHRAFAADRGWWRLAIESGVQSFTLSGTETRNDWVLGVSGSLGVPLGRAFVLELFAGRSDYAAQTAAGFRSRQLGFRLRWQAGR